jgi:hypothetical protein
MGGAGSPGTLGKCVRIDLARGSIEELRLDTGGNYLRGTKMRWVRLNRNLSFGLSDSHERNVHPREGTR